MFSAVSNYFSSLADRFGGAWNRFWFTPSDPYPLSILRVLTGIFALYLHATYTFDLHRFFAADGLLPVETIAQWQRAGGQSFVASYWYYVTDSRALWAVHIAGLLVLGLYTIGFLTRVTSVLALVVTLSYTHRAAVLTSDVEPILAMLQFYLCLAPAGAYLSVDRLLKTRRAGASSGASPTVGPSVAATIATRLIQVHLSAIYLMMALAKLGPVVVVSQEFDFVDQPWWSGIAVWQLMSRPESRLADLTGWFNGDSIGPQLYALNAWTHAIVLFELAFGLFIWNRTARPLLLTLSVVMWVSLAVILGDAAFCGIMLIAGLAFAAGLRVEG
ncbi:MAG: hypothetical protein HY000_17525 [Planctomycetes bacterium]|nr:hypothetical protein [Planctomycetota bacterium]